MGSRNLGHGLHCFHVQDPQIGLPAAEMEERILIGTELRGQPLPEIPSALELLSFQQVGDRLVTNDEFIGQRSPGSVNGGTAVHGEFVIEGRRSGDAAALPGSPMRRKLLAHEKRDCIADASAGRSCG
jgi:hypothetical protein